MSETPILTIGIPAYNRTAELERLINQLIKEDLSKFVLLISDDASPDDPSHIIEKYKSKIPNLIYIRNKNNLGFSNNVCQIFNHTKTSFIWFICDDDSIIPGSVTKVVEKLIKHDPTVAVFNHTWTNPYGIKKIAGVNIDIIHTKINSEEDYSAFMRTTFLSTLVLKKITSSDKIRKTDYKNNVFVQISLSLLILSKKCKFAEISDCIIERYVGYKYGEFFKFYIIDHLRAIFIVDHIFDNSEFRKYSIREIPSAFQLYLSQKLGLFKYNGIPTIRTIREIIQYYEWYSLVIFAFIPLYYLIPSFILKYIYKTQLDYYYNSEMAKEIYKKNIDRAYHDNRKTGFSSYR
jgi:glycosyltransferase involved in cell wall biosynthesis